MAEVRYFGMLVTQNEVDAARSDAAVGRFVPFAEPLPVGTQIEIDGAAHRVTRVDEGLSPGCWVLPEGVRAGAAPQAIEAEQTTPTPPPAEALAAASSEAVPEAVPEAVTAGPPSEPPSPDEGGGGKRKRRPKKTMMGR